MIWRVEDIDLAQAEALLQAIAREFDGDHAATDAARILRVPGFMNKTYDQDFLVSAQRKRVRVENLSRSFGVAYESVALLFPFFIVPSLVPAPFIRGCPVRRFWWHGQAENEVVYYACHTDRRSARLFHPSRSVSLSGRGAARNREEEVQTRDERVTTSLSTEEVL